MSGPDHDKHYRSSAFRPCRGHVSAGRPMLIVLFAALCAHTNIAAGSTPPQPRFIGAAHVTDETPAAASAIDSVCEEIRRGDFESAREIVRKSAAVESKGLGQLETIIDEYMAIKARRRASQNVAYREQISKLEKLRQKGFPKDINDVSKVLEVTSKALEYSSKEQEQALLNDILVRQTVRQAERIAAEFESKGRWLDAYKICYSKLEQMYKDDKKYSDYAKQLLAKAEILAFLQDSPCQSCQERYAGIEKQMFLNAVDYLDSSYVNIVDYRRMTIKAVNRCKLLAEVMSNSHLEMRYKIRDTQYKVIQRSLAAILDEVNQSPAAMKKDELIDVFERVLALSESPPGGGRLPPELLITQFAKGALSALDPYTVICWPSQAQNFNKALTNQFTGIGIRFSKKQESPKVISVLPDTPAYHSGIEAGDVIKAVDGLQTSEMPPNCVAQSIAGPEGTKVTLTIKRQDEHKERDITLRRTNIVVPSVRGWQRSETGGWRYMIDARNKIGYIRISGFNSRTVGDFDKILARLESQGLKGLILDLRSNPGGLLNSAIEIADRFIEEGLIARIQPRCGMPTYISANKEKTHPDYPMVVLIDHSSASSAEILAGVLQEPKHNRATIVGERSYGKGSVQSIVSHLGGGATLKYTTAYYYLPSGQRIKSRDEDIKPGSENWGLLPDVNVKLRSDELRKMANVQKENESAVKDRRNNALKVYPAPIELPASAKHFAETSRLTPNWCGTSRETIDADPQLGIGLLVLQSKMIESGHRLALN
ncbi:MAG TPA: S41 family peptidase [Sedimentisphaerales bacterium]|nr:S41 family peptidase [Sedimentisphaerales bacterium]